MMREVFIVSDNIISPLGCTTEENFYQLTQRNSGISHHKRDEISEKPFYASILDKQQNDDLVASTSSDVEYTKFERLIIHSISKALELTDVDITSRDTVIV